MKEQVVVLNHGGLDQTESGSPVEEINFAFQYEGLQTGLAINMSSSYARPPTPQSILHLTNMPSGDYAFGPTDWRLRIKPDENLIKEDLADVAIDDLKV